MTNRQRLVVSEDNIVFIFWISQLPVCQPEELSIVWGFFVKQLKNKTIECQLLDKCDVSARRLKSHKPMLLFP